MNLFSEPKSTPGEVVDMKWPSEVIVYTDGASRGNPGPASIGIYVTDLKGKVVFETGEALGIQTNNFAEYTGVLRALEVALSQKVKKITLRSDSQLLIRQLNGEYKVKSETLRPLYHECVGLLSKFASVRLEHVPREENAQADRLANLALDS